ncbi:hypothetical protein BH18THE2_BH18THE2_14980 [soil metagenome]
MSLFQIPHAFAQVIESKPVKYSDLHHKLLSDFGFYSDKSPAIIKIHLTCVEKHMKALLLHLSEVFNQTKINET